MLCRHATSESSATRARSASPLVFNSAVAPMPNVCAIRAVEWGTDGLGRFASVQLCVASQYECNSNQEASASCDISGSSCLYYFVIVPDSFCFGLRAAISALSNRGVAGRPRAPAANRHHHPRRHRHRHRHRARHRPPGGARPPLPQCQDHAQLPQMAPARAAADVVPAGAQPDLVLHRFRRRGISGKDKWPHGQYQLFLFA
ncbi:hypothetical protein R5R35_003667 [Gryllus longicercus]|uniref:Uncharacterized protein n=1 Tax=Gryllus longicercus TaxID=2509291 RepID=A0AAN9W5P0_9ORTH